MLRIFGERIVSIIKLKSVLPETSSCRRQTLISAVHLLLNESDVPFKCDANRSSIPNSGTGVYLKNGGVKEGQTVCLYAGSYYPPPPAFALIASDGSTVTCLSMQKHTHEKNEYLLHCNALGGYIDGKDGNKRKGSSFPCAVAQLINHPPRGEQPNVRAIDFYWKHAIAAFHESLLSPTSERIKEESSVQLDTTTGSTLTTAGSNSSRADTGSTSTGADTEYIMKLAEALNPIGDGPWYFDPGVNEMVELSPKASPLAAVAFIALRDIQEGEELFFDYRYGPKDKHPSWYSPVVYKQK